MDDVLGYLEATVASHEAFRRKHPWQCRIDNGLGDRFAWQRWLRKHVLRRFLSGAPVPSGEVGRADAAMTALASLRGVRDVAFTDGEDGMDELCVAFSDGAFLEITARLGEEDEPILSFVYHGAESDEAADHWLKDLWEAEDV